MVARKQHGRSAEIGDDEVVGHHFRSLAAFAICILCSPPQITYFVSFRIVSCLLLTNQSINHNSISPQHLRSHLLLPIRLTHALLDLLEDRLAHHARDGVANLLAHIGLGSGEAVVGRETAQGSELSHVEATLTAGVEVAFAAVAGNGGAKDRVGIVGGRVFWRVLLHVGADVGWDKVEAVLNGDEGLEARAVGRLRKRWKWLAGAVRIVSVLKTMLCMLV